MSQKVYLVMEQGWEYNDENYFRSNGGHPKNFFDDKEKAEAEATRLNLEAFKEIIKSGQIREYGYSLDEVLAYGVTEDDLMFEEGIFMTIFGKTAEDWWRGLYNTEPVLKIEPTEMQWIRLMHCFTLGFYEVVAVEKG